MDLALKDKKVLITGGSKGIGLACAKAFIAEGAKVALVSRSQQNLDQAKKSVGNAYTIAADLIDAAAAAAMVERVEKEFGSIEKDHLADLVILDANPLEDIRNVRRINRVIKGGVFVDLTR